MVQPLPIAYKHLTISILRETIRKKRTVNVQNRSAYARRINRDTMQFLRQLAQCIFIRVAEAFD